ncbi:L-aspartate oxidase [Candidatus Izemoplasma sp. B36]|uniref:L-aspartate oxidase n=1 Tax=Candidatus Izemoplasma sp. B36 TaxID=3242468 RepID=UPI003557B32D
MNKHCDVLIIGTGLAGLFAAANVDPKYKVFLVTKTKTKNSNSRLAQGGIACEYNENKELHESHIQDTLRAGAYLNEEKSVRYLVDNGYKVLKNLIDLGVNFDLDEFGNFLFTREGGHSTRRIFHSGGDATGRKVVEDLRNIIRLRKNIHFLQDTMALDLIKEDGKIVGCIVLENEAEHYAIYSKKTIIATGGIGSVYGSTTNDLNATGDGIGMAYRAGCEFKNMEFVQFHPTALYSEHQISRQRFLISEAVRGEGAYLRNVEKERFMIKYDPERMELAPRDIVSQAIYREMYDTWTDHVYLDTTHLDPKFLEKRFPTIFEYCKKQGYILGLDLIPVAPAEHFLCGGIKTDLLGRTKIDNLYAIGECAYTGVHGANRLASNSLLECLVFGFSAAKNINETFKNGMKEDTYVIKEIANYNYNYKPIRKKIGDYMDEHVSIVRNEQGLKLTKTTLENIKKNLEKYPNLTKYYYETLNMVQTALLITNSALAREESIGCHLRIK